MRFTGSVGPSRSVQRAAGHRPYYTGDPIPRLLARQFLPIVVRRPKPTNGRTYGLLYTDLPRVVKGEPVPPTPTILEYPPFDKPLGVCPRTGGALFHPDHPFPADPGHGPFKH
ncbi:hypothetical protein GE09DRAFT_1217152 [Coniochaeta sp. 2T2.1]|nr:hypothetical protein GE09DRAFT_1217152 [Coniochaeta sp. 2T2.1]